MTLKVLATYFFICSRVNSLGKASVRVTRKTSTKRSRSARSTHQLTLYAWGTRRRWQLTWPIAATLVSKRLPTMHTCADYSVTCTISANLSSTSFTTGLCRSSILKCQNSLTAKCKITKKKKEEMGIAHSQKAWRTIMASAQIELAWLIRPLMTTMRGRNRTKMRYRMLRRGLWTGLSKH